MQHSYEALDRTGGFSRVRLFAPLKHRDFRLLWTGMSVSLLGDGIFFVALAWQVYALSNVPTALAVVGIAMTVPTIAFLLLGGVISDRFDRRRVMLAADVLRGIAVGTIAVAVADGRACDCGTSWCWLPSTASAPRSSIRRSTRSSPSCCRSRASPRRTRSTSSSGRSPCGSPDRRSAGW